MSEPCVATIKINIVVYKPGFDKNGIETFTVETIDTDSFVAALSGENGYQCVKEIKKLLQQTKEVWPSSTYPESLKLIQTSTSEPQTETSPT